MCGTARRRRQRRSPTKAPSWPRHPQSSPSHCDAVITILTDASAIDAVYNGKDGVLSGNVAGKLFIEMSTVSSATERALAPAVAAKSAALVECPVGGA